MRSPVRSIRAALFAAAAVGLVVALRARSDGPRPGALMLVAATALVALLVRPLTAREHRLPALVIALAGVQLVLRSLFLLTSTGHFAHAGTTGLFCSPASSGSAATSCLPTERGGWLLLAVQLLAALLLAGWLRDVEAAAWNLATLFGRGVGRLGGQLAAVAAALGARATSVMTAAQAAFAAPLPTHAPPPSSDATRCRLLLFSRTTGRRGPPRDAHTERTTSADLVIPRIGTRAARVPTRLFSTPAGAQTC